MPVESSSIIYPMFAMFLLTLFTLQKLFRTRVSLAKAGLVSPNFYSTYKETDGLMVEPDESRALGRHFSNLFEAPTLFYVVCLAALALDIAGTAFQVCAWLYVIARIAHSIIHMGRNRIAPRIYSYMTSWLILTILWIILAISAASL